MSLGRHGLIARSVPLSCSLALSMLDLWARVCGINLIGRGLAGGTEGVFPRRSDFDNWMAGSLSLSVRMYWTVNTRSSGDAGSGSGTPNRIKLSLSRDMYDTLSWRAATWLSSAACDAASADCSAATAAFAAESVEISYLLVDTCSLICTMSSVSV